MKTVFLTSLDIISQSREIQSPNENQSLRLAASEKLFLSTSQLPKNQLS